MSIPRSAGQVVFEGKSVAWLADYLSGEGRSRAEGAYFLRLDRIGCGMDLIRPNKFPFGNVTPVAADWREGAEQPSF